MPEQYKNRRELAWRVFAREYNASTEVIRKEEEMTPSYVLTPLGAMANRVLLSGVVTEIENAGTESDPFWRLRITDPTGVFYLSAGQYQQDATKVIAKLRVPTYVIAIGKTRTYTPEGGSMYVSVMAENIAKVTKKERDIWLLDTVKKTRERLACISEAMKMDVPDANILVEMGFPHVVAQGAVKAIEKYDSIPLEEFSEMLIEPLRILAYGEEEVLQSHARGMSEEESTLRREVLKLIEELSEGEEGAVYQELIEVIESKGMDKVEVEDTINRLLEDGLLFEPVLGRLKRI